MRSGERAAGPVAFKGSASAKLGNHIPHSETPLRAAILVTGVAGSTVTFRCDDGRVQKYRIVGEVEADPKGGSISFVSPVARSLMGKAVGDVVGTSGQELEIIAIS